MTTHAIAMVKWSTFRPSEGMGGAAVYDYGSNQSRLVEQVANGGTLWLVTSRRRAGGERVYHLAYKLVNCRSVEPFQSLFSGKWKYVVRSGNWSLSRHFGYNDATNYIRRLRLSSGSPMAEVENIGLRLRSIPKLVESDIELLERLQHKIECSRSVFISYSRLDAKCASIIEGELGRREISTSRDVAFLQPGQEWEAVWSASRNFPRALERAFSPMVCHRDFLLMHGKPVRTCLKIQGWATLRSSSPPIAI